MQESVRSRIRSTLSDRSELAVAFLADAGGLPSDRVKECVQLGGRIPVVAAGIARQGPDAVGRGQVPAINRHGRLDAGLRSIVGKIFLDQKFIVLTEGIG